MQRVPGNRQLRELTSNGFSFLCDIRARYQLSQVRDRESRTGSGIGEFKVADDRHGEVGSLSNVGRP